MEISTDYMGWRHGQWAAHLLLENLWSVWTGLDLGYLSFNWNHFGSWWSATQSYSTVFILLLFSNVWMSECSMVVSSSCGCQRACISLWGRAVLSSVLVYAILSRSLWNALSEDPSSRILGKDTTKRMMTFTVFRWSQSFSSWLPSKDSLERRQSWTLFTFQFWN